MKCALVLLVLAACPTNGVIRLPEDSGPPPDSGVPAEDGGVPDGGEPVDGGRTDGGVRDAGARDAGASDAGSADAGADGGPVICGTSGWTTYGHDALRTFASDGCAEGPLTLNWSYAPHVAGQSLQSVEHALATPTNAYLSSTDNGSSGSSRAIDKVTSSGSFVWQFYLARDEMEKHWETLAFGKLLVAEDALNLVDDATGKAHDVETYDTWGPNLADGTQFYLNCDVNSPDGPGLFVGPFQASGTQGWTQNAIKKCGIGASEEYGSLVLDHGTLFRGGNFVANAGVTLPMTSGVASFDVANGTPGWTVATTVQSAMSAGDGKLFLIEQSGSAALLARDEATGAIAWSTALTATAVGIQAPVLADGLAIIVTSAGVEAYQAATGAAAWAATGLDALEPLGTASSNWDRCPQDTSHFFATFETSLAAALGSQTLIVTAKDGVHILSLSDGTELWSGAISGVKGPLKNPVVVGKTVYAIDTGASVLVSLRSP